MLLSNVKFELWKNTYFIIDKLFYLEVITPPFFAKCLEVMTGRIYKKGDIITEEGECSFDLYLLCCNSQCDVYCEGVLVNSLHDGEYFGETAIFTSSKKRTATVKCVANGDYLVIPGRYFYKLILDFEEERTYFSHVAVKYLTLYNQIVTPQKFGLFISKQDKIYKSVLQKNLFKNPSVQKNLLFYRRNFEDEEDNKLKDKNKMAYIDNYMFNEELEVLNDDEENE
jgi:signal-transduction protein with cAMP-binding, CBS, and nucleotidyltransferase domain